MKIELFYSPVTCAMAPYINLTEANAEFEVHALNFRAAEHLSAEYRKINPKHKVPMLVVDGERLTETAAIHLWIARAFPEAKADARRSNRTGTGNIATIVGVRWHPSVS